MRCRTTFLSQTRRRARTTFISYTEGVLSYIQFFIEVLHKGTPYSIHKLTSPDLLYTTKVKERVKITKRKKKREIERSLTPKKAWYFCSNKVAICFCSGASLAKTTSLPQDYARSSLSLPSKPPSYFFPLSSGRTPTPKGPTSGFFT
jgi:hypothetical protein